MLHGAKPADLSIEQAIKFELVIHLKTAQALVLTSSPLRLFQATEVIRCSRQAVDHLASSAVHIRGDDAPIHHPAVLEASRKGEDTEAWAAGVEALWELRGRATSLKMA